LVYNNYWVSVEDYSLWLVGYQATSQGKCLVFAVSIGSFRWPSLWCAISVH